MGIFWTCVSPYIVCIHATTRLCPDTPSLEIINNISKLLVCSSSLVIIFFWLCHNGFWVQSSNLLHIYWKKRAHNFQQFEVSGEMVVEVVEVVATKNTINREVVTRGSGLNLTKQIIPAPPPSCYSVQ